MSSNESSAGDAVLDAIGGLDARMAELRRRYAAALAECDSLRRRVQAADGLQQARQAADLDALLAYLGRQVFCLPQVAGGAVHLLRDAGDALATAYLVLPEEFKGIERSYRGFLYPLPQQDVNAQVFQSGDDILVTPDTAIEYGESTRLRFDRMRMSSLLVVPLRLRYADGSAEPLGVISLFSQQTELARELAAQVAAIVEPFAPYIRNLWKLHQAQERSATVEVMYARIQQFIASITEMNRRTEPEQVYGLIGREFIDRFGFHVVDLMLADEGKLVRVHTDFSAEHAQLGEEWHAAMRGSSYALDARDGQSALVFINNKRLLVADAMQTLHLPMSDKDRVTLALLKTPRTFLLMPIRFGEQAIGVMALATLDQPMPVSEAEMTLIELLASFISTAIRNAQAHSRVAEQKREIEGLNQQLRDKVLLLDQIARKDRLTGLNNFGNFEEELKRRTREYERSGAGAALSMILLDVDHFKRFNDTYGHPAGNVVLQEVAARILKCSREMDFVARYGGEEFAVILPQCDLDFAVRIAERIRSAVADAFMVVDGAEHRITISGGCAQYLPHESYRDFVNRVDQTLYAAKHNGRNRIERAAL